jgi:hypothetical protein
LVGFSEEFQRSGFKGGLKVETKKTIKIIR